MTHAEDLEPDQLEEQAIKLVVKSMERRTGGPVEADNLGIHVVRSLTDEQFKAAEIREFSIYAERFAHFDRMRACAMAAWLFQCLRPIIEQSVPASQRPMYQNEETLADYGAAALHDGSWEEVETAHRATLDSLRAN